MNGSPNINIILSAEEVQHLVNVLGEMPTKANVWMISQKVLQQAQTQMNDLALQQAKDAEKAKAEAEEPKPLDADPKVAEASRKTAAK